MKCASEMFFRYGIKSVNMNQIAEQLGISKRTIYELFESKEQLLEECVQGMLNKLNEKLKEILEIKDSAEATRCLGGMVIEHYKSSYQCAPTFFRDIRQYPNIHNLLEESRLNVENVAREVFQKATAEGFFDAKKDFDTVHTMWSCYHRNNIREDWEKRIEPKKFAKIFLVCLDSVCTQKGQREIINELSKKYQLN